MYNRGETKQVTVLKTYNMMARLDMMYVDIAKYSDLLLFSERKTLLIKNLLIGPRTAAN